MGQNMGCSWRFLLGLICALSGLSGSAKAQDAVVFDIDGTLTPNVYLIDIARSDAVDAVNAYADAGVQVVYLTARIPFFQDGLSDWLVDNGFPPGELHLTKTETDEDDHATYKARVLASYVAKGWTFIAAFGDSTSDFRAYAAAGIPQERVFALRRLLALTCQDGAWQGCYDDWSALDRQIAQTLERE